MSATQSAFNVARRKTDNCGVFELMGKVLGDAAGDSVFGKLLMAVVASLLATAIGGGVGLYAQMASLNERSISQERYLTILADEIRELRKAVFRPVNQEVKQ